MRPALLSTAVLAICPLFLSGEPPAVKLIEDADAQTLTVEIDDAEAFTYRFGTKYALPHVWPLRSPAGRSLTVQHPEPYPHHRSLWIADRIQLDDGPIIDFYHCTANYLDPAHPERGYHSFIRHTGFDRLKVDNGEAFITESLEWVIKEKSVALEEAREFHIVPLGDGEYRIDLHWTLTATNGDVTFHSDWVHYAWPYVRMGPVFSGEQGGTIIDDQGRTGQEQTNEQYAVWIDYSNEIDGKTEGLAVFIPPGDAPRKWLTREYGTFGPRRVDAFSGSGFVLKQGESLEGRAAILVHRGDSKRGRVAERYQQYVEGLRDED